MLRALSQAALESSSTGSLSSLSTVSWLDEEEGTESEDEKIGSCWRFALRIGYWIPTWGHLSLANVGRSSSAGALALFHCYLFLAGGTLIFLNSCSALLRFYMGWFVKGSVHLEDFRDCCNFQQILHSSVDFMGLFLRSCLVIQVTSDILRFTYLLGVDAWRPDAFETYRRLVVFDAWHELDAGEFYIRPWSTSLRPWQKAGDVIFQLLLHTSLNLIPITALILSAIGLADKVMVCKLCLFIGTIHILVFYFCFAFGEMWLKLQRFRESWALARRSEGMAPFQRRDSTWARSTIRRISEATEKRSICVLCCTIFEWLQAVMPSWLGIGVAIAGVSFHRPGLIVVGSIWTGLLLLTTVLTLPWGEVPTVGSSWITRYFPRPEILQEWGENWCNLGLQAQVRQRYHAALMLALCAVIFGAFRFHSLTLVCLVLLSILFSRMMWLRLEGKLGWLYAFMEWLIVTICFIAVIMASSPRNPFEHLFLMCLAVLLHFGYTRGIPAGERVRISSEIILGFVAMLFLVLTCSALLSFSEDQQWSAFGPAMNKTRFLPIATAPTSSNPVLNERPICLIRFNYGPGVLHSARQRLSVTEFALMASLTYEMPHRVVEACSHYFPKWRVEGQPENARKKDWTSFLMLTSEDNSTTVIAVRGTFDFLDVLDDVALWLVPALMQVLNLVGPDISSGTWGKAMSEYAELLPVASVAPDQTFKSVLAATEFMMESHPGRRFFLTGHSLGGGIAKLVALQLPVQSRPMTIAFAAPGVQYSARVLLSHMSLADIELRRRLDMEDEFTLDVIPRHDLVSQVDWNPSSALIAPCDGQPWECHSIFRVIWGIFSICGSMTLDNLMVPCGPFGKCA